MSITLFDAFRVATSFEKWALIVVLVVAILGLLYAAFLTRQVLREPKGTDNMQKISNWIRTGGNAYLRRQFRTILLIIFVRVNSCPGVQSQTFGTFCGSGSHRSTKGGTQ